MRDNSVTTPTPHRQEPLFEGSNTPATGAYTPSECLQFPHAVSHALIMGMAEDKAATLPDLAARLGLSIPQVHTCLETTRKAVLKLISGLPPTVSKPSQE